MSARRGGYGTHADGDQDAISPQFSNRRRGLDRDEEHAEAASLVGGSEYARIAVSGIMGSIVQKGRYCCGSMSRRACILTAVAVVAGVLARE
jgi:hypothetical protein